MSSVLASALPAACTSTVRLLTQACMALHTRLGPQLERCYSSNPSVLEAEGKAPEKLKRHLRDFAKLPWEVGMTRERAAQVLGSFLGVSDLEPAVVLKLNVDQIEGILRATTVQGDKELDKALFAYADAVTNKYFEEEVFYRGIVEFSNVCQNDCGYCGIRKHQHDVHRYTIPIPEVLEVAKWAFENKMGTLMLQSGELRTPQRMAYLTELIREIRKTTIAMDLETRGQNPKEVPENTSNLGLCVALSVGELEEDHYRQVYEAGARRYLLRIETSNPDLYHTLHPADMSWSRRVECLQALRRVGFQIGTGIMVGLPGQSLKDLAGDIVFFREMGANMIGMGPYITEPGTPVAEMWEQMFSHEDKKDHMRRMFDLTTRMNSLARITLGNANIAATTALQAIDPLGREIALRRGSNILMPILTPTKYREDYQLYEGKPCITDTADECRRCLNARISMIGKKLRDGVWGDPPNFVAPASGLDLTGKTASSGRSYSTYQQQHLIGTGGGRTPGGGPIPAVSPLSWGAQNFPARHHCR